MQVDLKLINHLVFKDTVQDLTGLIQILNNKVRSPKLTVDDVNKVLSTAMGYNSALTEQLIQETIASQKHEKIVTPELLKLEKIPIKIDDSQNITKRLELINDFHKFFDKEDPNYNLIVDNYWKIFIFTKFCADIEKSNVDLNNLAYHHAYKIMVGWSTTQNFIKFLHDKGLDIAIAPVDGTPVPYAPVYDTLSKFFLPVDGRSVTLDPWQKFIMGPEGVRAMEIFTSADQIERNKAEEWRTKTGALLPHHMPPDSMQEAKIFHMPLKYRRFNEDLELAKLLYKHDFSEEIFNESLEIKGLRKTKDNLPDIVIDGNKISYTDDKKEGINTDGYIFGKLPIDDPNAYIIGVKTGCCLKVLHQGGVQVFDAITKENNGFFVLWKDVKPKIPGKFINEHGKINYDKYEIIAVSYSRISTQGNLILDSIEMQESHRKDPSYEKVVMAMYEEFSKKVVLDTAIARVTIGQNSASIAKFEKGMSTYPEIPLEGVDYHNNIKSQTIITESEELTEIKKALEGPLFNYVNQITSVKQGKKIIEILHQRNKEGKALTEEELLISKSQVGKVDSQVLVVGSLAPETVEFYTDQYTTFDYFMKLSYLRIGDLLKCKSFLDKGYTKFDVLKNADAYHLKFLYMNKKFCLTVLEAGDITIDEIIGLNVDKLDALFSVDGKIYQDHPGRLQKLKQCDIQQIKALISQDAQELYQDNPPAFDKLVQLKDANQIKVLVSKDAQRLYQDNPTAFDELRQLDINQGQMIISSYFAEENANYKGIRDKVQQRLETEKTNIVTAKFGKNLYQNQALTDEEIKTFSLEKLKILFSDDVRKLYIQEIGSKEDANQLGLLKVGEINEYLEYSGFYKLKTFEVDKILALTSQEAQETYRDIPFDTLAQYDVETIKVLASPRARSLYHQTSFDYKLLNSVTVNQIKQFVNNKISLEEFTRHLPSASGLPSEQSGNVKHCASGASRVKKSVNPCGFTKEDVDQFNDAADKRDINKIIVNSDKFLQKIADTKDPVKRTQLVQFVTEIVGADTTPIVGDEQSKLKVKNLIKEYKAGYSVSQVINKMGAARSYGKAIKSLTKNIADNDWGEFALTTGEMVTDPITDAVGNGFVKFSKKLHTKGYTRLGQGFKIVGKISSIGGFSWDIKDVVDNAQNYDGSGIGLARLIHTSVSTTNSGIATTGITLQLAGKALQKIGISGGKVALKLGVKMLAKAGKVVPVLQVVDIIIDLADATEKVIFLNKLIGLTPVDEALVYARTLSFNDAYAIDIEQRLVARMINEEIMLHMLKSLPELSNSISKLVNKPVEINQIFVPTVKMYIPAGAGTAADFALFESVDPSKLVVRNIPDNTINLNPDPDRTNNIRVKREVPLDQDAPLYKDNEAILSCAPVAEHDLPTEYSKAMPVGEGYCRNMFGAKLPNKKGLEYYDYLDLGKGKDTAVANKLKPAIFNVGEGNNKHLVGSHKDDILILNGNEITGVFDGNGGDDILDLSNFARDSKIKLVTIGLSPFEYQSFSADRSGLATYRSLDDILLFRTDNIFAAAIIKSLTIKSITSVLGRPNLGDVVIANCDTKFIDLRGGNSLHQDQINIPTHQYAGDSNYCDYNTKGVLYPFTIVNSYASRGKFEFIVNIEHNTEEYSYITVLFNEGDASFGVRETYRNEIVTPIMELLNNSHNLDNPTIAKLLYNLRINVGINKLDSLEIYNPPSSDKVGPKEQILTFSFNKLKLFARTPQSYEGKIEYDFADNKKVIVLNDKLYVVQSVDQSIPDILTSYRSDPDIKRLGLSMLAYSTVDKATILITAGTNNILENDPEQVSHLFGSTGDNVYFIHTTDAPLTSTTTIPDVTLYKYPYKTQTNTLDLSQIINKIKQDLNTESKVTVTKSPDDGNVIVSLWVVNPETYNKILSIKLHNTARGQDSWCTSLKVILGKAPVALDCSTQITDFIDALSEPIPYTPRKLYINENSDISVLESKYLNHNTLLIIPIEIQEHNFCYAGDRGQDLGAVWNGKISLYIQDFYNHPVDSLTFIFDNKKLPLIDEWDNIESALACSAYLNQAQQNFNNLLDNIHPRYKREINNDPVSSKASKVQPFVTEVIESLYVIASNLGKQLLNNIKSKSTLESDANNIEQFAVEDYTKHESKHTNGEPTNQRDIHETATVQDFRTIAWLHLNRAPSETNYPKSDQCHEHIFPNCHLITNHVKTLEQTTKLQQLKCEGYHGAAIFSPKIANSMMFYDKEPFPPEKENCNVIKPKGITPTIVCNGKHTEMAFKLSPEFYEEILSKQAARDAFSQVSDQLYVLAYLEHYFGGIKLLQGSIRDIYEHGFIHGPKYTIKRICHNVLTSWQNYKNQIIEAQKTISPEEQIEYYKIQQEIKNNLGNLNEKLNGFIEDIQKLDDPKGQEKYREHLKVYKQKILPLESSLNSPVKPISCAEFEKIKPMPGEANDIIQDLQEVNHILQEDLQFRVNCGVKLIDTKPDGNCLFAALGSMLDQQPFEVRKEVCKFLRKHKKYFKAFVKDNDLEKYVHEMEQDGTWGDHLILTAFASKYNQTILTLKSDGSIIKIHPLASLKPDSTLNKSFALPGNVKEYIAIGRIEYREDKATKEEGNHYVALQAIDQYKFKDILQSNSILTLF